MFDHKISFISQFCSGADNTLLEESSAVGASESVPYYAPFNPSRVALKVSPSNSMYDRIG